MMRSLCSIPILAVFMLALSGCETEPKSPEAKANLHDEVVATLNQFYRTDPGLRDLLDRSAGYAVFPTIGKGGAIVGGAYGRGEVYQNGQFIGYADMTQGSLGLQLGGQKFSEILVFQTQDALDRFKRGEFTLGADASAVAATAGASTKANFREGVAVFTLGEAGLMADLSIAGQKFDFVPADRATNQGTSGTMQRERSNMQDTGQRNTSEQAR